MFYDFTPANFAALYPTHGDKGTRTPDLVSAIDALSQLSYIPWCWCDKILSRKTEILLR